MSDLPPIPTTTFTPSNKELRQFIKEAWEEDVFGHGECIGRIHPRASNIMIVDLNAIRHRAVVKKPSDRLQQALADLDPGLQFSILFLHSEAPYTPGEICDWEKDERMLAFVIQARGVDIHEGKDACYQCRHSRNVKDFEVCTTLDERSGCASCILNRRHLDCSLRKYASWKLSRDADHLPQENENRHQKCTLHVSNIEQPPGPRRILLLQPPCRTMTNMSSSAYGIEKGLGIKEGMR